MSCIFPNLAGETARRGIRKSCIARAINVSYRAYYNKLIGKSPITWDEACVIHEQFFPDMTKEVLFARSN